MSSKGLKPHRGHKKYILVSLIQAIMWKCHQRSSQHKRPSPTATMSFTPSKPVILGGWGGYLHVNGLPGWNKLHDPMDCSLPGSSTHGIFQARVLEWVAITFSEARISLRLYNRILRTQHIPSLFKAYFVEWRKEGRNELMPGSIFVLWFSFKFSFSVRV